VLPPCPNFKDKASSSTPLWLGELHYASSVSSETVGVRTSILPVDRFLGLLFRGLLFFAVRLRLILDFFAFRFLAM
jgi:hypothetical protein